MYYIRTADRLQRTSTWIGALDGGLDRVRAVVVDDELGLGAELEADMARHVDTYFDEWRATLEDPEKPPGSSPSSTPGHPRPDDRVHHRARADPAGPRGEDGGPLIAGASIPVGAR